MCLLQVYFWSENLNDLNKSPHCYNTYQGPPVIFFFFFSWVDANETVFQFQYIFKHIFMHAFTQNTHRNTLDERKSLATVSRIQTEPRRWTDGEMGTGSLKSHISIYICCLTGESVTAKPNKQLLAKHTHTSQRDNAFSPFHTHTPSL